MKKAMKMTKENGDVFVFGYFNLPCSWRYILTRICWHSDFNMSKQLHIALYVIKQTLQKLCKAVKYIFIKFHCILHS